jgi:hypothetical protein
MAEVFGTIAAMDDFSRYARDTGIVTNDAIKPHRFPGRGLGIAATRKIPVCALLFMSLEDFSLRLHVS